MPRLEANRQFGIVPAVAHVQAVAGLRLGEREVYVVGNRVEDAQGRLLMAEVQIPAVAIALVDTPGYRRDVFPLERRRQFAIGEPGTSARQLSGCQPAGVPSGRLKNENDRISGAAAMRCLFKGFSR